MNLKARTAGTFPAARACCGALQSALPLIPPSNRKSSAAGIASFLCGACRVRFFRDLDEPEANTVAYGGDAYAMRQRVADAQQYALFAQALVLTLEEERYYLEKSAAGDLDARNVLIERNLRLVAHIMNKG